MPSFHQFAASCRDGEIDPRCAVELAAMEEAETTCALLIRVEREAREYADSCKAIRVALAAAYGKEMRRREGEHA